jgi:hypothetical protein
LKKLAILIVLALELAVSGCGNNVPAAINNTSTNGNWEAQLINGTGQASLLNFVVSFSVINGGPLDVTGFAFFNQGACFSSGLTSTSEAGTATFTTNNAGQVNGTLNLTVTSNTNGSVLKLTGQLTGRSNGTTTTTGTLSNGVVVGSWDLTPGKNVTNCSTDSGSFVMCQGAATCSTTPADAAGSPTARDSRPILTEPTDPARRL